SYDDSLLRSDLPALMLGALWIHLAGRAGAAVPRAARIGVAGAGFVVAALLVVEGWGDLIRKGDRTPLVAALPGTGGSRRRGLSHRPPAARRTSTPPPARAPPLRGPGRRRWPRRSRRPPGARAPGARRGGRRGRRGPAHPPG